MPKHPAPKRPVRPPRRPRRSDRALVSCVLAIVATLVILAGCEGGAAFDPPGGKGMATDAPSAPATRAPEALATERVVRTEPGPVWSAERIERDDRHAGPADLRSPRAPIRGEVPAIGEATAEGATRSGDLAGAAGDIALRYPGSVDPAVGTHQRWARAVAVAALRNTLEVQPPPTCAYGDVLTARRSEDDWPVTLLDTTYRLPPEYVPPDLVDVRAAGLAGGFLVRAVMIEDLRDLVHDARAAGAPIRVVSGYRSHGTQAATLERWARAVGREAALRVSARPGHSEHQLGTTLDVTSAGGSQPWSGGDWATSTAGRWMTANAWRYGFVMSYPRDASEVTCYDYEPWHWRYVGREAAAAVRAAGLTLREYLWALEVLAGRDG